MKVGEVRYRTAYGVAIICEHSSTENADFDGDALNGIGLSLEEIEIMFEGFDPKNMMIDRTTGKIRLGPSALEAITLFQFSAI
jgi:hypothetical protein